MLISRLHNYVWEVFFSRFWFNPGLQNTKINSISKNFYKDCYKLSVNNFTYFYSTSMTLYQALIQKDWYIPRFCYHVKLLIAGNCRMCVVEVENSFKPAICCSLLLQKNMSVNISSILVFKARESVLQFILNNHPLDCPICDQGGERDSQDQYIVMGSNESRYFESNKKYVRNKNISVILKLSLNKCINCSRCTRFSHMFIGDYSFSLLGRGENINISNYLKTIYFSEISGNTMDLCPVGAITSKFIAYGFRVWEFNEINYVDFFDILHPPIRIDYRGLKILRILPLMNDFLKEEWISDRFRFNTKVFSQNRLLFCFYNDGQFMHKLTWKKLFKNMKNFFLKNIKYYISKKIFYLNKISFCKHNADFYNFIFFKILFKKFSMFNDNSFRGFNKNSLFRKSFLVNSSIDFDFLKINKFVFYNVNLRNDFPILNFKIREKSVLDFTNVLCFGFITNLNYYFEFVSKNFIYLLKRYNELNSSDCLLFYSSLNEVSLYLKYNLFFIFDKINKINLSNSNNLSLLINEYGINGYKKYNKLILKFSSHFDFINLDNYFNVFKSKTNFIFAQNKSSIEFDFIIPIKQNFEKSSIFLSLFGRVSDFTFASYRYFFKTLRNEWFIFKSFFNFLNTRIKFEISFFKSIIFPKKWKYSHYSLKTFNYNYEILNQCSSTFIFNFDYTMNFFSDKLSNSNFSLKYVLNLDKLASLLTKFVNLNKIHWLF